MWQFENIIGVAAFKKPTNKPGFHNYNYYALDSDALISNNNHCYL